MAKVEKWFAYMIMPAGAMFIVFGMMDVANQLDAVAKTNKLLEILIVLVVARIIQSATHRYMDYLED